MGGMLLLGVILLTCPGPLLAPGENEAMTRLARLRAELGEAAVPAWAGRYTSGLTIAPKTGYVVFTENHLGAMCDYGTIEVDGARIQAHCDESPRPTATWWTVPWDERVYIIPEHLMGEFCALVNDGTEPRRDDRGWPMMRASDPGRLAYGVPDLPAQFQHLLTCEPIAAQVLRFETRPVAARMLNDPETEMRVVLHAGKRDGVSVGMGFSLGRDRGRVIRAFVESVDETACVARVDDSLVRDLSSVRTGVLATTGPIP